MKAYREKLRALGYRVEWSQGATPEDEKDRQREAGWLWEGDDIPDDHPEDMILVDDADQPNVYCVDGFGVFMLVREDDKAVWKELFEKHDERLPEEFWEDSRLQAEGKKLDVPNMGILSREGLIDAIRAVRFERLVAEGMEQRKAAEGGS